jgi:hypothetical protein
LDLRPKLIVRKGATCRHESRGSPALRAVCTQWYLSSWPIGVVEHRTTRHQGRDVSAGTTAGAHRQYGIRASALRQTLVGICTGFDRIEHAAPFLRARRMPWKKPRPFPIRSQAWSGTGLLALICLYMGTCCRCAEQSPSATVSAMAMRRPFAASGACAARVWCAIRARSICVHRLRG